MDSKKEVKQLLKESGNGSLFTEENYRIATVLTKYAEKRDPMLKQFFLNAEGFREQYKHDLIVKNKNIINHGYRLEDNEQPIENEDEISEIEIVYDKYKDSSHVDFIKWLFENYSLTRK